MYLWCFSLLYSNPVKTLDEVVQHLCLLTVFNGEVVTAGIANTWAARASHTLKHTYRKKKERVRSSSLVLHNQVTHELLTTCQFSEDSIPTGTQPSQQLRPFLWALPFGLSNSKKSQLHCNTTKESITLLNEQGIRVAIRHKNLMGINLFITQQHWKRTAFISHLMSTVL